MLGDLTLEALTWRLVREWGAIDRTDEQLQAQPFIGFAYRNAYGRLVAIGGVRWDYGQPWAVFDATSSFRADRRSARIHRLALSTLEAVASVEPVIFAWLDESAPRARAWMTRLGFRPSDGEVWIYGLGANRSVGRGHGAESEVDAGPRALGGEPGACGGRAGAS